MAPYTLICRGPVPRKTKPKGHDAPLVSKGKFEYFELNDPRRWQPTAAQEAFAPLMEFIRTLPFERTARIIVMCDDAGREVTMHRDHYYARVLHEFVWFRTNLDKPFYVQDARSRRREYVRSYTAWFDTVNQYHGTDAIDGQSISVRVDGRFSEKFRARIPRPATNPASTPALWASLSG